LGFEDILGPQSIVTDLIRANLKGGKASRDVADQKERRIIELE
jgi:hypothetical protein